MIRNESPNFPYTKREYDEVSIIKRLQIPKNKADVVFDSDTFNEIDDQFALAYMLKSEDKLNIQGIYAVPFANKPGLATSPDEGMEKSYLEILKVLKLIGREDMIPKTRRGSDSFLLSEEKPVRSDAANDLVLKANSHNADNPLYIISIGALTNVASALLIAPEIEDRIVVIWLGGHSLEWPDIYEHNLRQDLHAARVVFKSNAPIVLLPCKGVASGFTLTKPEMEYWLRSKNAFCDYLCESLDNYARRRFSVPTWSKPIWDVTAVAWLLGDFTYDRIEPTPIPGMDFQWEFDKTSRPMKYVYFINRDQLMFDMINKLTSY